MTLRRLLLGAVGALVVIGIWMLASAEPEAPAPGQPRSAATDPAAPSDATPLTVTYVFDGDTIEAQSDGEDAVRIRLIGIDTPEGTPEPECGADTARDRLRDLLPEGSTVRVAADREDTDRYGRLLRYVWTGSGAFVNATLVREGHAAALRIEPNTAHADAFAELESDARRAGLGQWGACR